MFLKVERRFLSFYSMLLVNSFKTLVISALFLQKSRCFRTAFSVIFLL